MHEHSERQVTAARSRDVKTRQDVLVQEPRRASYPRILERQLWQGRSVHYEPTCWQYQLNVVLDCVNRPIASLPWIQGEYNSAYTD